MNDLLKQTSFLTPLVMIISLPSKKMTPRHPNDEETACADDDDDNIELNDVGVCTCDELAISIVIALITACFMIAAIFVVFAVLQMSGLV